MMDDDKKVSYNKTYIEELYVRYMTTGKVQEEHKAELQEKLRDKTVLLIAPGKSSIEEKNKIVELASSSSVLVISVNHAYTEYIPDFIFISNLRRFREMADDDKSKCIVTSNIPAEGVYVQTKYRDLLNKEEAVSDNAGLMAIKFLANYGVKKIYLAGFDGYSHDVRENYGSSEMAFITRNAVLDAMNVGMSKMLNEYKKCMDIDFLTIPKYVSFD